VTIDVNYQAISLSMREI